MMLQRFWLIGLYSAVVAFIFMHHLNQEQLDRMYHERHLATIDAMLHAGVGSRGSDCCAGSPLAAILSGPPGGEHMTRAPRAYGAGTPGTWLTGDTVLVDIERGSVDRMLAEVSWLAQARMVPALDAGRPVGLVLYAIRTGSLYSALGVHNGDVLRSINGAPVLGKGCIGRAVPDDIGSRDFIDLELTRKGKPLRIVALLHPGPGPGTVTHGQGCRSCSPGASAHSTRSPCSRPASRSARSASSVEPKVGWRLRAVSQSRS